MESNNNKICFNFTLIKATMLLKLTPTMVITVIGACGGSDRRDFFRADKISNTQKSPPHLTLITKDLMIMMNDEGDQRRHAVNGLKQDADIHLLKYDLQLVHISLPGGWLANALRCIAITIV
uniref:Uncharacterized protein n=1 Tax=Glossina palpalis gambiensis TaxID=67801 RepID=A0A1B0B796_9MUSC